jgi:small-conductance mechanosensitive channel
LIRVLFAGGDGFPSPPVSGFWTFLRKGVGVKNLAQSIPARYRQVVYSVLAMLVGLEAIFDVVEDGLQGKLLAALTVLGFGVAFGNVKSDEVEDV